MCVCVCVVCVWWWWWWFFGGWAWQVVEGSTCSFVEEVTVIDHVQDQVTTVGPVAGRTVCIPNVDSLIADLQ